MKSNKTINILKATIKIILMGDSKVGKTSIINRYLFNKFNPNQNQTVGVDFFGRNIDIGRLQLWDTSGNERYLSLIPNYVADANCAIMVYDTTSTFSDIQDASSLENVQEWIKLLRNSKKQTIPIFLMGNKIDLSENKMKIEKESVQKIKRFEKKYKILHFTISALNNTNVSEAFSKIIDRIMEKQTHQDSKIEKQSEKSDKSSKRSKKYSKNIEMPQPSSDNFVIDEMQDFKDNKVKSIDLQGKEDSFRRRNRRKSEDRTKIQQKTEKQFNNSEQPQPNRWKRYCCPCLIK